MDRTLAQKIYLQGGLGINVERAAQADPQNVWQTIFTIAAGPVLVTSLVGVRTVIQAGGASNKQYRHSIGPTVLCAVAAITGNAILTMDTITGNFADALQVAAAGIPVLGGIAGGLLATGNQGWGILMQTGNIQVTMTAAAGTGSTAYYLTYIPINPGASVVAA